MNNNACMKVKAGWEGNTTEITKIFPAFSPLDETEHLFAADVLFPWIAKSTVWGRTHSTHSQPAAMHSICKEQKKLLLTPVVYELLVKRLHYLI